MSCKIQQLARQAVRLTAAATIFAMLAGCQGVVGNPSLAQVRIIDVSPDAPSLDIYQGPGALAYGLGFGTITSYVPITPGTYAIAANSAGTAQVVSTAKETFLPAGQYTVLIGNNAASPQQLTLKDQSQPAPSGQIALRIINQATRSGAVDVYLVPAGQKINDVTPIATNVIFGANTGYLNIPTGTYSVVLVPAGTIPTGTTVPAYIGTQVAYSDGSAHTIILIDQRLAISHGLQVITADDYDDATS